MTEIRFLDSIGQIADDFDAFIIDLWGVLHDGSHPYPGAVECLAALKNQGKKIILLSNAPRRAVKAKEVLDDIGFSPENYDHVLTSGEITFHALENDPKLGGRFYYVGPEKDEDILDGSRFIRTMEPVDADFAIVTGFDHLGDPDYGDHMAMKMPEIEAMLRAELPLYCANPDLHVVKQNGKRMLCAGVLAQYYQHQGGEVHYFGKPYKSAYEQSFGLLGVADPTRYCAIGDSLHTDIAGANENGIFSVFVAGGIFASEFGIKHGQVPSKEQLVEVCDRESATPSAVIPAFIF